MKTIRTLAILLVVAAAFFGGYAYRAIRAASGAEMTGRKILYWVDPMHPAYKSDKPGIAPDCGMKLDPVYADGRASGIESSPAGDELAHANELPAMPAGTVEITPEKQQLIGVKYGLVERSGGARTIRAVGRVAFDETRIQHIHTKIEGWIDQVFVDYSGQPVRKGQPLITVYSPEMLASQRELLLAAKARETMRGNPLPAAFDHSESLFQAARRRLELWDLSQTQIDRVLATGEPIKNITLYSPIEGYVTDRKAFPQLKVMPETDLYTIVDLSRVWLMADVFESDAADIHAGQAALISLQAAPGRNFSARVGYIQPQVDPLTRTLKVRLDMENPGLVLKPDMYADVEFRIGLPSQLSVPAEAVLDAGERKTVFVDRGNGFFEPRQVTTGERSGDRIQILGGLAEGERIVTSGNFLIDSESQMKAAAAGMGVMAGMPVDSRNPTAGREKPAGKSVAHVADVPGMRTKQ